MSMHAICLNKVSYIKLCYSPLNIRQDRERSRKYRWMFDMDRGKDSSWSQQVEHVQVPNGT